MRASPTPLRKIRIWSLSGCVSSPISPPGGMVMLTSWLCSPVQSTRRKSALSSATVAIRRCSMRLSLVEAGRRRTGALTRRTPVRGVVRGTWPMPVPSCSHRRGATDLDELPAGVAPGGGVQLEAAVDDDFGLDQRRQLLRVELAELRPLGQVQHDLRAQHGLLDAGDLGEALARREPGLGVVDPDVGAVLVQPVGHGQGRRVAGVVGARLERGAEDGDALAVDVAAGLL